MGEDLRYDRYTKEEIHKFGLQVLDFLRNETCGRFCELDQFYNYLVGEYGYAKAAHDIFSNLKIEINESPITLQGDKKL